MWSDPYFLPLVAFPIGLGMLLFGGVNVLLARRSAVCRLSMSAGACAVGVGPLLLWLPDPGGRWVAAAALTAMALTAALLVSPWLPRCGAPLVRLLSRPRARWAGLAVCGLGLLAASVVACTAVEDRLKDEGGKWLAEAELPPPKSRPVDSRARTDRGRAILLFEPIDPRGQAELDAAERRLVTERAIAGRLLREQPANDAANCHGWVFTGGRYWLTGESVLSILTDNGYARVADPRPGDLIVYYRGPAIIHTAVVRAATPGRPVLVEGKWGWMGVFLHPAADCSYGSDFRYYRSPRTGHLLAGLSDPTPTVPSVSHRSRSGGGPLLPDQPQAARINVFR